MAIHESPFSRRRVLLFAAGVAAAPLFASTPFWEKKDPKDWTNEEIDKLTTNSPWAKEVSAAFPNRETTGGDPGGSGRQPIGIGIPGIGIGGGRGGGGGRGRGPANSLVKGTIMWQSAQPIIDAIKPEFPEGFDGKYAIQVSGFPLVDATGAERSDREDDQLDDLKRLTYLRPDPGSALQPGIVNRPFSTGESILFGFSKDLLRLASDVKEVVFTTRFGRTQIQAKFVIKEMMYHGKLAV